MTPLDFLRAVWPGNGVYCLAIPHADGSWQHLKYDTIEDAAANAVRRAKQGDIYFNIHSLIAKQVPHRDAEKAAAGKTQTRVRHNMLEARCFFFDLDVGAADDKYDTREEALLSLKNFIAKSQLPMPLITSSGGGFHVYWRLTDAIASEKWRDYATQMRQLAFHYGLKPDKSRTVDTSSVLRVIGTFNRKDPNNFRPVELLKEGVVTATGVFLKQLSDALIRQGLEPQQAIKLTPTDMGGNLSFEYDGRNPDMMALFRACPQTARIGQLRGRFSEPEWYSIAIGLGRFTTEGQRGIHKLSKGHPDYSESACNAKIKQSEQNQTGPTSCTVVAERSSVGDTLCRGCLFAGKVGTPIQAALLLDAAPAPEIVELIDNQIIKTTLPDAPKPFTRLKDGGGIAIKTKNAEGDDEISKIFDYDLFPIRRVANRELKIEQQHWHVGLPGGEAKDFVLDAEMLYDQRKFVVAIANQGMYAHKGHLSHLQEYMVAYIAELQKLTAADTQSNHLGWGDDHQSFILPDRIMMADGTVKASQLSIGAQRASAEVYSKGTLQEQCRLIGSFYNHPDYIPNQVLVLAGLGAPLFYMTPHHGAIVNASGDAGASKSTTLYATASSWGHPTLLPINGTNNGATVKGRNERVTVLANLPVCVDEITHMPNDDAVDLAMSISQPGHRIRLQTDGVERANTGGHKATLMLSTANSSLHTKLSMNNAAGTAGSMRVFEIIFRKNGRHQKHEADDFLFALKENFGHLGPAFMAEVMKRREYVERRVREVIREIDIECRIEGSERFWSATAAVIIVACEITFEMGLLPFDAVAIRRWICDHQIPFMRGVVVLEYSDPLAVVGDFLESINGSILVMRKGTGGNISHVSRAPMHGALVGHYDLDDNMIYVLKKAFKDYCSRTGANSTKILDELHQPQVDGTRIVPQTNTRRVLGAGTELAKGQTWCFAINMSHPLVSGIVDLKVIVGGKGGDISPAVAVS